MPYFDKPTMICGMDIYKVGSGGRSILAVTCSINQRATKYWSMAKVQDENQDVSNILEGVFYEALEEFKKKNTLFPEHVILYRDGMGESQKNFILQHEVPQINLAFKRHGIQDSSKLMVILVNKRINQRLFNTENPNRIQNPQPGTVVDSSIVS